MPAKDWSLPQLLSNLHQDIQNRLQIVRTSFGHPVSKGDGSEKVWLELLNNYLPKRYEARKAHVVDSKGNFSDQIDIVVFDRQYSPFIFDYEGETIIPAESVYAVFEAKQSINASNIEYAKAKVATVRSLHRTSLPIPHAGGVYPPKPLIPILGGLLTFESDWTPALGSSLEGVLYDGDDDQWLNLGCVAAHGHFFLKSDGAYTIEKECKPATAFLFKLIETLQFSGTVPMIDIQAYAQWLTECEVSGLP